MGEGTFDILLIEDNIDDVDLVKKSIERCRKGTDLMVFSDGEKAMDFVLGRGEYADIQKKTPRFILLDIKIPKVNGFEVIQAIKLDETMRNIPVVMFTSSEEERDILTSYDLGANSYIVKPLKFEKFVEAISVIVSYWLTFNKIPQLP